jgi:hypothetical protein
VSKAIDSGDYVDGLARLSTSWSEGNARQLAINFADRFETAPAELKFEPGSLQFRLDLSRIYMQGLGERVPCLLLGGTETANERAKDFWHKVGALV